MTRTTRAVLPSLAALALGPVAAGAQTEWRDQIARQIASSGIVAGYRAEGFAESHDVRYDLVADGETRSVTFALEGGRTYRFVAKCDHDCSDLDVRVYDERGTLVDSDVALDDHPLATATPTRDATYRVEVTMADCAVARCGWGLVAFASPAAARPVAPAREAEPAWRAQIRRQLETSGIVAGYREAGFAESHDVFYDLVATGESETVTVPLEAGRAYRFVGKCDADCSDLDFRLYDPSGALLVSDLLTDDVPVLEVTPARSGAHRLRVTMAACSVSLCGWGVTVLVR